MRANANKIDFGAGCPIDSYPENQFTDAEYAKLKTLIKQPFHFINSDIETLHTKLTTEYDLIDISKASKIKAYCGTNYVCWLSYEIDGQKTILVN